MAASAPNLLSPLASPHLGSSDEADSASELVSPALSGGGFDTAFASSTTLDSYHDAKDARFLSTDTLAADEPAPELLPPWSVPASPETAHICRRAWDGASAGDVDRAESTAVIAVFQAITLIPLGFYMQAWSKEMGSSVVDALLINAVLSMWIAIGLSALSLFVGCVRAHLYAV